MRQKKFDQLISGFVGQCFENGNDMSDGGNLLFFIFPDLVYP